MNKVLQSLNTAKENGVLKPRLRLHNFYFRLAPDSGMNPNYMYVHAQESGNYLGKVSPEGTVSVRDVKNDYTTEEFIAVRAGISLAMNNPQLQAENYGKETGSCSCCGRMLTNPLSVKLGIGPVCRGYYGWDELQNPQEDLLESLNNTKPVELDFTSLDESLASLSSIKTVSAAEGTNGMDKNRILDSLAAIESFVTTIKKELAKDD